MEQFNPNSPLDNEIEKAQKLLNLYQSIKDIRNNDDFEFMTTKDVAEALKISVNAASQFMNRPDFPKLEVGKEFKVSRMAFIMYTMERRVKQ